MNNVNIPLFHLVMTELSLLYEIYLTERCLHLLDLLRDLLQIGLLLTKYSTSSSFILEIQSHAWLCYINLSRRWQWWWKQNKEQGNNVFTVISIYSQQRCPTGANKIPKHSEHFIWIFYNDFKTSSFMSCLTHHLFIYTLTHTAEEWVIRNKIWVI